MACAEKCFLCEEIILNLDNRNLEEFNICDNCVDSLQIQLVPWFSEEELEYLMKEFNLNGEKELN